MRELLRKLVDHAWLVALVYALLWWGPGYAMLLPVGLLPEETWDAFYWVGLGGMKLGMLALVLASLLRVYTLLARGRVAPFRVLATWCVALLAVLVPLMVLRGPVANLLDEATSHVLSHDYRGYPADHPNAVVGEQDAAMNASWRDRWARGVVPGLEVAFVLLLASLNTFLGVTLGRRRWVAAAAALFANPLLALVWSQQLGLLVATYDEFHGGVLSSQLSLDLALFFLPRRLEAAHASLVYLAVLAANAWLLRSAGASRPVAARTRALASGGSGARAEAPA